MVYITEMSFRKLICFADAKKSIFCKHSQSKREINIFHNKYYFATVDSYLTILFKE